MEQIRRLERGHIVHTVADHRYGMPLPLERAHQLAFILRRYAAKHGIFAREAIVIHRRVQRGAIHRAFRPAQARLFGNARHGQGAVAADHLHGNALLIKVAQGIRCIGAQGIAHQQ